MHPLDQLPEAPRDAGVSAHLPAGLPLQARIKPTLNLRPSVRGATIEQNQTAGRVVDYLHKRILDNPERYQRYRLEEVAATLGIDLKRVRLALAHAGIEWLTVEVSAKDRAAIRTMASKAKR
jgi:ABC-type cobalamin transport system ATPase subunit